MLKIVHEPDEKGKYRIAVLMVTANADFYWDLVCEKKKNKIEAIGAMNARIQDALKWGVISITSLCLDGVGEDMQKVGESVIRKSGDPIGEREDIIKDLKYLLSEQHTGRHDALVGLIEMYGNAVDEHKQRFE